MSEDWTPSADFRQRAAYWGQPVPESMDRKALLAALASFTDYWISEQKVFSQTQWEQKLARHLQNTRPTQPRGNNHAELDQYPPTYNAAQRRMLDAYRAQLRDRGQSVGVLDLDDGNLLQSLAGQKRPDPVGPMDCADWEFDRRPDDERL
ncbi:DnaT-like ssDNA-binding domain-containing protein [Enterobacter asburiae]|nr:DnaT-like ssDNA-binding domain-containing protein [Enterobacter asburiae]